MRGHRQREFGNLKGDCFRAALASATGFPYGLIPHFCLDGNRHWWRDTERWARRYGLRAFDFKATPEMIAFLTQIRIAVVAAGRSPRGPWNHCVVWRAGRVLCDPHPSGSGLRSLDAFTVVAPVRQLQVGDGQIHYRGDYQ